MNSPKEVLEELLAGDFQSLIGITESVWIDAKEIPYILDTPKKKMELAKDVSAFANSGGGIIVLGFDASKDPATAVETISKVCPFPSDLLDANQYRQILGKSVYPPLNGVTIQTFDSGAGDGRVVAAIVIDSALGADKPYLVANMLDEANQSIGAYMGYFERKHDLIPPITIGRLQQLLAAGQQWSSIDQRLLAIESNMNSWSAPKPAPPKPWVTKEERENRLKAARIAMGRDDAPIIYFTATPQGECDFPTLFKSRAERVVRLIENPPQLRPNGFEI